MTDPPRWNENPSRSPSAADLFLRGARRPQPPSADDLARLESTVAQIPRRASRTARRWSRVVTGTAAVVVVASLGTTVWALHGRRPPPPAAATAGVAAETARPIRITSASLAEVPADIPTDRPTDLRVKAKAVTRRSVGDLTREIALIDAARRDVDAAPARALAALDQHRRQFPRGQLASEREFLAVEALHRANRPDEARRRAEQLRIRYPSSSYAARLLQ